MSVKLGGKTRALGPLALRDRDRVAPPDPPFRLHLDQKDWIAFARLRLGRPCSEPIRRSFAALAAGFATGNLIVPYSESHVLEIGTTGQPVKREDVAITIMLISRRHALAPLHALWVQEADAFMARQFGALADSSPQPFGVGLAFALGFSESELTIPWDADTSEADVALVEAYAMAEPHRLGLSAEDIERRSRWTRWADFLTSTSKAFVEDREKYPEQDRMAMLTIAMLGNGMIHRAIGNGVPDAYIEFLRDEGPWAVVREMPSLAVMTELHRARYPDANKPWTVNDYHDVLFLSVALAYCSAVCPDKRWADLASRSEYIAGRGAIITSGQDAVGQAVQLLFGESLAIDL
jgi:hypothetical protein